MHPLDSHLVPSSRHPPWLSCGVLTQSKAVVVSPYPRGAGEDLDLTSICVLHSRSTLYVEIALSSVSDGVSYSDGYNGEWLVSFLSKACFAF